MFNRDRSETVDKQVRRLDELCQDAAGVNFNGFASCLRDKGAHWSAEVFNKLPGFISRLEKLKADINNLNDAPIFLDIDDEVVNVKSLYGDYVTRGRIFSKPLIRWCNVLRMRSQPYRR